LHNMRILSALLMLLIAASAGVAQPDFSSLRKLARETIVAATAPSMAIAVVRNGRILYEEGFGWADRERRIPATEHTMYYTASVTKTFTTTALMILQEQKRLDLDRPVNDYLGSTKLSSPAFDPAGATIRRIATHTAGLTTYNPTTPLPIAEQIRRFGILFWPPGERFDYSNLGPILLDHVVERVSGKPYADFLREQVLWPLGMTRAAMGIPADLEQYTAQRYSAAGGKVPPTDEGVYCSVHDLAMFAMFHLKVHRPDQKQIITDASIDAMQNETVEAGGGRKYGLGWWTDDLYGYRNILAQGGTVSDQAWVWMLPDEGIAVVVLTNYGNVNTGYIRDESLSILLPDYRKRREEALAAAKTPAASPATPQSEPFTRTWTGVVRTEHGDIPLTLSSQASGDIHAKLGSQLETLLNQARFRDGRLSGIMTGDLGVGATAFKLSLFLRDGVLKGAAVTDPSPQLPHWVELKKTR
jgi:CubicO group peptidase (beta-lactamase class C family)